MSTPPVAAIPKLSELSLVIETPRLTLREPRESDADVLFPIVSEPALSKFMTWSAHQVIDETRGWLRASADRTEGTDVVWIIEHDGAPVGCIGLHGITWAIRAVRYDHGELGYWIAPAAQGKGLMTEAVTAVTQWAFDTLGLHKVTVSCFEGNAASKRVIEKVGFRFYGRQEEDLWRDGKWHAHLRYELTITEWSDTTRTLRFTRQP